MGGGMIGLLKGTAAQLLAFTGVSFGAVGAFQAVRAAIRDYSQTEDSLIAMQLALGAQGKFSQEAAEGIAQLAGEFERTTAISDSTWLDQFTRLIQYGGKTEEIGKLGATLKNLAGIMGGDVSGAGNLMIRALNGNYREFEKFGFVVDKNATALENWKSFVEQTERGAGILEKRTQSLSGSWDKYTVALSNFSKAGIHGLSIQNLFKFSMDSSAAMLQFWADKVGIAIPKVKGLTNASSVLTRSLDDAGESTETHSKRLKAMGDAADKTAKQINLVKDAIKQMHQLDDDESSARMDFELALVDDEEKRTGNTLGAARKRAGIKGRYAREKNDRANQSDFAALTIENKRAGEIIGRRNYLEGGVRFHEGRGNKAEAESFRSQLKDFNETTAPQLAELQVSGVGRFSAMQSRNRVYGFQSATAVVQGNTEERGIRDQMTSNAQSGKAVGVFRELSDQTAYIPGAIESAQNATKLIAEMVKLYGANSSQIKELWQALHEVNARAKKSREL